MNRKTGDLMPAWRPFFGTCTCDALVYEETPGVFYDWRFGVYPRTRHSCLATVQREMVRQRPQLRAEAAARIRETGGALDLGE